MFDNTAVSLLVNFAWTAVLCWCAVAFAGRFVPTVGQTVLPGHACSPGRKPRQIGVTEKMPPLQLLSGRGGLTSCPYILKRMKTQMAKRDAQTLWTKLDE